jgi:UDP-galactose transporter B1
LLKVNAVIYKKLPCDATNFIIYAVILTKQSQPSDDKTPRYYYALAAFSNLLSMVSSNMALRWISYPTQVIAKSAKPIPVMLLGVFLAKKSYPFRKYFHTLLIVIGVTIFMYKVDETQDSSENTAFGQILILFSLFMNGITGVIQDRITSIGHPSPQLMMMWVNTWCTIILTIVISITGEWIHFLKFTSSHPEIIKDLLLISSAGAFGQFFIFTMISNFGSLPCSIVTTVRKFFAVLFSVMVFGNSLSRLQWFGAILVFAGLFADMFVKARRKSKAE